jgi:hypothetical protein
MATSAKKRAEGIVALFNASDDTVVMVETLLKEIGGQTLVWCHFADLKRGHIDFTHADASAAARSMPQSWADHAHIGADYIFGGGGGPGFGLGLGFCFGVGGGSGPGGSGICVRMFAPQRVRYPLTRTGQRQQGRRSLCAKGGL